MRNLFAALLITLASLSGPALSQQELVWVQIEAHPTLNVAQQRAASYARLLEDVSGHAIGRGWYGIVLGPYTRADAERVLQVYRAQRQIPQDSFLTFSNRLGQSFFPVGAVTPNQPLAPETTATPTTQEPEVVVQITPADESPAEARRSERLLDRDQRKDLQTALQSAGFYTSAIDGAFGRGTRASMRAWQEARGYEPTGVLTTLQRQALMDEYNAPLIETGMAEVVDTQAGIALQMPTKEVRLDRYEAPFAHYGTAGDIGVRVVLISQPGEQATLYGLYDIMQTLEIVPLEGPRERGRASFTLEGRGNGIVSYTEAALEDGQIKGFTLIWPAGDEERRGRILEAMKASFTRLDGVLDPAAGADAEQRIDLVSGLEVRKPKISRSGFYADRNGTIVTVSEAVQSCTRITIDQEYEAKIVATDAANGIAVLSPAQPLAPISAARFSQGTPRLQSDVAVAGYSYEGTLGGPSLTFGTLADVQGLGGEGDVKRLAMASLPGDVGGPVFDAGGGVFAMLLPMPETGRQLPEGVRFAAGAQSIRALLDQAGLSASESPTTGVLDPVDLGRMAAGMTVLVSCWG